MASWPARTWSPAELVTSTMMNGVRDQLNELHGVALQIANWTPRIQWGVTVPSDITYTNQFGRYIRVGPFVWAFGRLTMSNKGAGTGTLSIGNLPLVVENVVGASTGAVVFSYFANMASNVGQMGGLVLNATNRADIYGTTAATTAMGGFTNTIVTNTTDFIFIIEYLTSAP